MAADIVQGVVVRVKADGTLEITKLADQLGQLGTKAGAAGRSAAAGLSGIDQIAGGIKRALLDVIAPIVTVAAAFEAVKAAIGNADYVRDLAAQMASVTGSTKAAAASMDFFNEAAKRTRSTGDELSRVFVELLPLAMKRGFSPQAFQDVTVQLAQAAARLGISFDKIKEDFEGILQGVPRARGNELLTALGLSPQQVLQGTGGAEKLMDGLRRLAKEGADAGQTFASTGKKIKGALLTAFAEGFNEARGGVDRGLSGMLRAFEDPKLLQAIKDIGQAIAEWLPHIADAVSGAIKFTNAVLNIGKNLSPVFGDPVFEDPKLLQAPQEVAYDKQGVADQTVIDYYRGARQQIAVGAQGPGIYDPKERFAAANAAGIAEQTKQFAGALGDVGAAGETAAKGVGDAAAAANKGQIDFSGLADKIKLAVDALLMRDEASQVSTGALFSAFAQIKKQFGDSQAFRAFGDQLVALGVKAGDLHLKLTPLQQAEIAQAKALASARDAAVAWGDAVRKQMDAVDGLAGSSKALDEQVSTLEGAFQSMADRGVALPDIASTLGPQADAVEALLKKMGKSLDDLGPEARKAFETVRSEEQRTAAQTASLQKEMEAIKQRMAAAFSSIFTNAAASPGITGMSDFGAKLGDQLIAAADKAKSAYEALLATPNLSQHMKDSLQQAIDGVQNDLDNAFRNAAQQAEQQLNAAIQNLGQTLGSIFVDLAETGGKNFGAIGAKTFQDNLAKSLQGILGEAILGALGGKPVQGATEKDRAFDVRVAETDTQRAKYVTAVNSIVGGIGNILQQFENAKKGQTTSVVGGVVGGAITGATIGSVFEGYGAIIGAIVGALIGGITAALANAKAKKAQPYAVYGIDNGQAYVQAFPGKEKNFANITKQMMTDMLNQMNTTLADVSASYIHLLLKLPIKIVAGLTLGIQNLNFAPTMDAWTQKAKSFFDIIKMGAFGFLYDPSGGGGGGILTGHETKDRRNVGTGDIANPFFDKNAQKNFLSDFDNWVKNTLPKEIAERFRTQVSSGFTAMGMTVDRFNVIWDQLQGMDPKAAMDVLNNIVDALVSFSKLVEFTQTIKRNTLLGFRYGGQLDATTGVERQRGVSDYQQSLIDSGEQLLKLGIGIVALPLKDQAAAAAQLGASFDQLKGNLISFLNTLIQMSKDLHNSIMEARFGIQLDQTKTPEDKKALLFQRLKEQEAAIQSAVMNGLNPADIQRLTQSAMDTINQIYRLDPTAAMAAWADKALAGLDKTQKAALQAMAAVATNEFDAIVKGLQPVIDFFQGLPSSLGTPLDGVATSADNASKAMDNFANNVNNWKPSIQGPGGNPFPLKTGEGDGRPKGNRELGVTQQTGGTELTNPVTTADRRGSAPAGADTVTFVPQSVETGGTGAPSGASLDAVVAMLKEMTALMPSPDVYPAMYMDLEKLVSLAGGKTTDLAVDWNARTDGGNPQPTAASTPSDVMKDLVAVFDKNEEATRSKFDEVVQVLQQGTETETGNASSLAARLDTAVSLLAGILDEMRTNNAMPPPPVEVRIAPMSTGNTGSGNFRQGAVTRRLQARL